MFVLLPVIVLAIVGGVVYLATRSSAGPQPAARPTAPDDLLADELERWVARGLVSEDQAEDITAYEEGLAAHPAPPTTVPAPTEAPARRRPVVAEALGYIGAVLAFSGVGLIVSRFWGDLALGGRLALSGAAAVVFLVAGFLVPEHADPALARLRWVLWACGTGAAAAFVGIWVHDGLDVNQAPRIVAASAAVVAVGSGLLWWWRDRPLQQLACLGAVVVFVGTFVGDRTDAGVGGLAVWAVGVVLLALGLRRMTPSPVLTELVGAVAAAAGSVMTVSEWQAFGLVFMVATAVALVALALVPPWAPDRADQLVTGIVGGLVLFQGLPATVGYFANDAGIVTGLAIWTGGAVMLVLAARRWVRLPVVVEVLGGLALVAGAAVTGVQSPEFASLFGIATGLALIGLGMLPGQVLLSLFGGIALLVNVPWAIARFFPGEGRAPLLLMVSGGLIVVLAVLLGRMGGRFRSEVGGHTPHPGPA